MKNKKDARGKDFLIFQEMELSSSNIKKNLIFSQKKTLLMFLEMEPCTFQTKLKKIKNPPQEKFLYFLKRKFFLHFSNQEPQINSLYFRKQNSLIFKERYIKNPGIFSTLTYLEVQNVLVYLQCRLWILGCL